MKRLLSILLMIAMLITLVGCGAKAPDPTQSPTEPSQTDTLQTQPQQTDPIATEPTDDVRQEPMFGVSMPVVTEYSYADDGTLIFSHTYQVMSLTVPDQAVADNVIVDFLNRTDASFQAAGNIYNTAASHYDGSENWQMYTYTEIYNPVRIDPSVLSLYGVSSSYIGASHPTHLNVSANYDLITGQFLTLDSILAQGVTWENICNLLINALTDIKDAAQLFEGYVESVKDTFRRDFVGYKNWYLSDEGLCFYFSPYEIAPYSSGTVIAKIPYSMLLGIIQDRYFPPEMVCDGEIYALRFEEADLSSFTQTCEVTTDIGGQKVIIHSGDTTIGNVRLFQGSWDEDGVIFNPTATIFACTTLTPGDAILVETFIPDVMPTLLLQYTSGGIDHSRYIFQSGEDGSILLLNE